VCLGPRRKSEAKNGKKERGVGDTIQNCLAGGLQGDTLREVHVEKTGINLGQKGELTRWSSARKP